MITLEKLRSILSYDPETGVWTWLDPPNHNTRLKGKQAGHSRADGYRQIRIDMKLYHAGRLAWFYMTSEWPIEEIDHIDRDPSNNKWTNLREATSSQNKYNRDGSGLRGVYTNGISWWAMAGRNGYLGTFATLEEASAARDKAVQELAGPFAELNSI